jgi:hypothetical protein
MNFSEFKRILGAEPRSEDPEVLRARDSNPTYRAAAEEAAKFEDKLEAALSIGMPAELLDQIARIPAQVIALEPPAPKQKWRWLAAAAVFVAAVGFASYTWYESTFQWESVDDYAVDHWASDGEDLLAEADGLPVDRAEADRLFASFGMRLSPALAQRIDFVHRCRTPDSRGAHMVITTDQGPVTLIFMPKVETVNGHILAFDNLIAATLQLERGSALVIGPNEEIIASVYTLARDGIRPIAQTT